MTDRNLVESAKNYAIKCHDKVNQMYDVYSYDYHLKMVNDVAKRYIYLIPLEHRSNVLAGCWVHDILEDTFENYNDVKKELNEIVAEYSYALTNEKGRNRKERANVKYYNGIKKVKYADFIKTCDRIANIIFSKGTGSSMFKKYKNEYPEFKAYLYNSEYDEMWKEMKTLLEYI